MERRKRNLLVVLIGIVIVVAMVSSFGLGLFAPDTAKIVLPTPEVSQQPGGEPGEQSGLVLVDVTPETVQSVIRDTLSRPDRYTRAVTIEDFWGEERAEPPMRTCGWTAAGPRRRRPCQAGRYVTPSWATGSSGCGMEATARPFPVRRTGTRRIWRASASPPMRTYWSWSRMPLPPPDMRRRAAWPAFMWRQARTRWAMWRSTGSPWTAACWCAPSSGKGRS
ncbi:MAG: hypothetical protein ACLRNQ_28080 [Flavonifractor plautii]